MKLERKCYELISRNRRIVGHAIDTSRRSAIRTAQEAGIDATDAHQITENEFTEATGETPDEINE